MSFTRFTIKAPLFCIFLCCALLPFSVQAQSSAPGWSLIWGNKDGLYRKDRAGRTEILFADAEVQKIIPLDNGKWFILTNQGIWFSDSLRDWEKRNQGLPENVIKSYDEGKKSLVTALHEIKALAVDQQNPELMVCASKDAVYLSRNGGRSWESLGMPAYRSSGIKAVAVADLGELTVFCSHSIYGVSYISVDKPKAAWIEVNTGLEKLETTDNPDEVSDIAVSSGGIYASQSFRRRLYKLDWEQKSWEALWSDDSGFGSVDSLSPGNDKLIFVRDGGIMELELSAASQVRPRKDLLDLIKALPGKADGKANCAVLIRNTRNPDPISLSELWLLDETIPARLPPGMQDSYKAKAANREGLYLPVNQAMEDSRPG